MLSMNASPPGVTTVVTWLDMIDEAMYIPEQQLLIREMTQMLVQDILNEHVPVDILLEQVTKSDGTAETAVPHTSWLDIIDEMLSDLSSGMGYSEMIAEAHSIVQGILHKQVDIRCLLHPATRQRRTPTTFFQQKNRMSNDLTDDDIFQAVETRLLSQQPYWCGHFDPAAISFAHTATSTIYVDLYYYGQVSEIEVGRALNIPPIIIRQNNIPPITQTIIATNPIRVPPNQDM